MKIDRSILACDDNPLYQNFWPLAAKAWTNMNIQPTLAIVGDSVVDESCGDIIRIPSLEGIPNDFIAQVVRAFLPILFPDDVCLTSDIDMLPMNKGYYLKSVEHIDENALVIYSADAYKNTIRFPMCYIAGKGKLFQEILDIRQNDFLTIIKLIKAWYALELGWNTDEIMLTRQITSWVGFSEKTILLKRGGWKPWARRRLDRSQWNINPLLLSFNYYIDAHMPRPFDSNVLKPLIKRVEAGKC